MKRSRAWENGGWREHYAMINGRKSVRTDERGHTLITYRYRKSDKYQDGSMELFREDSGESSS